MISCACCCKGTLEKELLEHKAMAEVYRQQESVPMYIPIYLVKSLSKDFWSALPTVSQGRQLFWAESINKLLIFG